MLADFSIKKIFSMGAIVIIIMVALVSVPLVAKITTVNDLSLWGSKMRLALEGIRYRIAFAGNNTNSLAGLLWAREPSSEVGGNAQSIPVLLYHGVGDAKARDDAPGAVSLEKFKDQLFSLKKAGWHTVGIEDLYAFLRGDGNLPDKSFVLTFDDGRKDSYYPVDPLLQALDYRAVNFIITKFSIDEERAYYLNKNELAQMVDTGRWDIESHGKADHTFYPIDSAGTQGLFLPNKIWLEGQGRLETLEEYRTRISDDLAASKRSIEDFLGSHVIGFAYPYGDYGQGSQNFSDADLIVPATTHSWYPMSFYQGWYGNDFTANYPYKDVGMVRRIEVDREWSGTDLLAVLDRSREHKLPYDAVFTKSDDWMINWGGVSTDGETLRIGATASTTGSTVYLDGTYTWKNYMFQAHVRSSRGKSVALIARFRDGENYVACNYTSGLMHIDQVLDGSSRTIQGIELADSLPVEDYDIAISVKGRTVACFLNGESVIETPYLDEALDQGGIGFKTWDPDVGTSSIAVQSVHVEAISE